MLVVVFELRTEPTKSCVPNCGNAAVAIFAGTLCGCELIAGIQDLQEGTPPSDVDSGTVKTDDASMYQTKDGAPATDARSSEAAAAAGDGGAHDATTSDGTATDGTVDAGSPDAPGPATDASASDGSVNPPVDAAADVAPEAAIDGSFTTDLIDDMESVGVPNGWLDGPSVKNKGTWYVFDDGTDGGVLTPPQGSLASLVISTIPGGRGSSLHAAHVSGNAGFTNYGAGMGFNLNSPSSTAPPGVFDASGHVGFTFYARALGDAGTTNVTFNVVDQPRALAASGGDCDGGTFCSGYYGYPMVLTPTWRQVTIYYSELQPPNWAAGPAFAPGEMIGCQFQANQGYAFDLWIDDISFIDP